MTSKLTKLKNNVVLRNFIYINLAKGLNLVTPLIITPFLIRTISLQNFGKISLIQVIASFFVIFCNYGLETSSVKEISISLNNPKEIINIFIKTYFFKIVLLIIVFPIFLLVSIIFLHEKDEYFLIFSSYTLVVGTAFFPDFFYQGTGKMQFWILSNLLSKIILFTSVFYFIDTESKYIYVNLLIGCSYIIVFVCGILHIKFLYSVNLEVPKLNYFYLFLKSNFYLMFSNLSLGFYSYSNVLVLGIFTSKETIGLYVAMERVIYILKGFVQVFAQSIFPRVCQISKDINATTQFYKKNIPPFMFVYYVICFLLMIFTPLLMKLLGVSDMRFTFLFRLFCISALLELLIMPFNQYLIASNNNRVFFKLIVSTCIFSTLSSIILIKFWSIGGGVASIILSQILLLIFHNPQKYFLKN